MRQGSNFKGTADLWYFDVVMRCYDSTNITKLPALIWQHNIVTPVITAVLKQACAEKRRKFMFGGKRPTAVVL